MFERLTKSEWYIKLTNFEYWPTWAFYFPAFPYYLYKAATQRNFAFFSIANPGIENGGGGMESKYKTTMLIPRGMRPATILVEKNDSKELISTKLDVEKISFPLIVKPDIGYRGFLVAKIDNFNELMDYLKRIPIDFIIQEYIDFKKEFGVFYHRIPGEDRGEVTSITTKEFLKVIGDGVSTVEMLVLSEDRARTQHKRLQKDSPDLLKVIPKYGESINLGVIGNHNLGTKFLNGNHLICDEVVDTFDRISKQIDGYNYGRFDLRCKHEDDLKTGENIMLIELNGVMAEPTHIYDPTYSYFKAVRSIIKHWKIMSKVAVEYHKTGIPYPSSLEYWNGIQAMKKYRKYFQKYS